MEQFSSVVLSFSFVFFFFHRRCQIRMDKSFLLLFGSSYNPFVCFCFFVIYLTNPMKLDGINIWPTPAMTTKVKSFLGLGNIDKGFILDNWTLTEPLKDLFEMDETFQEKKNKQDNLDTIILTEDPFLDLLDHRFDDERSLENDDKQFDPIKTLSVHEPRTLHNHFLKDTRSE